MNAATLADRILRLSSTQIPRRQLDLAITVIMLQHGGYNALLGYRGVRKGRYRVDHRFVSDLLKATKDHRVIHTPAFACLPRQTHRRLYFRYWHLRRRHKEWRTALGWTLVPFLGRNPQDGPIYAEPIWTLAMDPDEWVANPAILVTYYLNAALTLEQCKTLVAFAHDKSVRSAASMSSLGSVYKHLKNFRPEVREYLLSPATIATLRSANPYDGRARPGSYTWCIDEMRKALTRARRGHVPRLVK